MNVNQKIFSNMKLLEAILQMDLKNLLEELDDEARKSLFYFAIAKGATAKKLGISQPYLYLLKVGKRRITDEVIIKILKYLSVIDFIEWLTEGHSWARRLAWSRMPPLHGVDSSSSVNVFKKRLRVAVSEELVNAEVERFRQYLIRKGKSKKTIADRCLYLRKFLSSGYPLSATGLTAFFSQVKGGEAEHYAKAIRLYLRYKGRRDLVDYVPSVSVKVEGGAREVPRYEDVKKVAEYIETKEALYLYAMLAESGLRPGIGYQLTKNDVVLGHRVVKRPLVTRTKRFWFSFYYIDLDDELSHYIKELDSTRLFPKKPRTLRLDIYQAMEKSLGYRFRLYDLRDFWISYMHYRGVNPLIVEVLAGHKPPFFRVTTDFYLAAWITEWRQEYDKAELAILR